MKKRSILQMQKDNYWQNKFKKDSLSLKHKKLSFQMKNRFSKYKEQQNTFWVVAKSILPKLLISLLICAFTISLDYGMSFIDGIPKFIDKSNYSTYVDIALAFIAFNGVFLAIYYSSTASIFTAKYSDINEDVRNRFYLESTKYSGILINNVLMLLVFVVVLSVNFYFTIFASIIVGLNTLLTLYTFYRLASIAFALADLYKICDSSYSVIINNIKHVTKRNKYNVAEFQDYYCKQTKKEIDILKSVSEYQISSNKHINNGVTFCVKNLILIKHYYQYKYIIPKGSKWFDMQAECPYWFTADATIKTIALNTGTGLHYKEIIDEFWFEKSLMEINNKFLKSIKDNKIQAINTYLSIFEEIVSETISSSTIKFWEKEIKALWGIISKCFETKDDASLSLATSWTSLLVNIILGIRKILSKCTETTLNDFFNKLQKNPDILDRINSDFLYDTNIIKLLNSLKKEIIAEGTIVTPRWYLQNDVGYHMRQKIKLLYDFCDVIYQIYNDSCEFLIKTGQKEVSAITFMSQKEIKQKLSGVYTIIEEKDNLLKSYHVDSYFKEINFDYATLITEKLDINKNNIKAYQQIIELYKSGFRKDLDHPDYIGYAYSNIVNDSFHYIMEGETTSFIEHIKLLIDNLEIIENEVKNSILTYTPSNYTILMERSIRVCIMDLAGYYLYYNYLIGKEDNSSEFIKMLDEELVTKVASMERIAKYVEAYVLYTESSSIFIPNDLEFIDRKLKFQSFIKKNNLVKFETKEMFHRSISHDNKQVREFRYDESFGFSENFYVFFGRCYLSRFMKPELKKRLGWDNKDDQQN